MPRDTRIGLWFGVLALIILSVGSWLPDRRPQAEAQELKRHFYKVIDVPPTMLRCRRRWTNMAPPGGNWSLSAWETRRRHV